MSAARRLISIRGFTLIEALVSLIFVAIVFVALISATVSSRQAATEAARRTEAQILLRSLLAEVFAAERVPISAIRGEMRSYRWAIAGVPDHISGPVTETDTVWVPERVTVTVGWGANGRITAETIRLVRAPR